MVDAPRLAYVKAEYYEALLAERDELARAMRVLIENNRKGVTGEKARQAWVEARRLADSTKGAGDAD